MGPRVPHPGFLYTDVPALKVRVTSDDQDHEPGRWGSNVMPKAHGPGPQASEPSADPRTPKRGTPEGGRS